MTKGHEARPCGRNMNSIERKTLTAVRRGEECHILTERRERFAGARVANCISRTGGRGLSVPLRRNRGSRPPVESGPRRCDLFMRSLSFLPQLFLPAAGAAIVRWAAPSVATHPAGAGWPIGETCRLPPPGQAKCHRGCAAFWLAL